jgi:hypothetical protein
LEFLLEELGALENKAYISIDPLLLVPLDVPILALAAAGKNRN